jgi:hypothetical protein
VVQHARRSTVHLCQHLVSPQLSSAKLEGTHEVRSGDGCTISDHVVCDREFAVTFESPKKTLHTTCAGGEAV